MNKLFEVHFSVGNTSDTSSLRTTVSAFMPQHARAMIESQYGSTCHVFSVIPL